MMETYTVDVKISTRCEIKANSPTEAEEIARGAFGNNCSIDAVIATKKQDNTSVSDKNPSYQGRLAAIERKAKRNQDEAQRRVKREQEKRVALMVRISELSPRIRDLVSIANACIENHIDFPDSRTTYKFGYGDGYRSFDFCADGIYHHVGFMDCKQVACIKGQGAYKLVRYIGIKNGGCCGTRDFYTNGREAFSVESRSGVKFDVRTEDMEKFLKEYDAFERAFYAWIDSLQ